jgi:hypothetical protein
MKVTLATAATLGFKGQIIMLKNHKMFWENLSGCGAFT